MWSRQDCPWSTLPSGTLAMKGRSWRSKLDKSASSRKTTQTTKYANCNKPSEIIIIVFLWKEGRKKMLWSPFLGKCSSLDPAFETNRHKHRESIECSTINKIVKGSLKLPTSATVLEQCSHPGKPYFRIGSLWARVSALRSLKDGSKKRAVVRTGVSVCGLDLTLKMDALRLSDMLGNFRRARSPERIVSYSRKRKWLAKNIRKK